MKGWYKFRFGWPSFKRSASTYQTTSRPMTAAEKQAFDKVFTKMRETFAAMDAFFEEIR